MVTPVPIPTPIPSGFVTAGLLNVGPGSNPAAYAPNSSMPTGGPDASKGNVAEVWGFIGAPEAAPQQTSSPPASCAVYGAGGVLGVSGGPTATIQQTDIEGVGVAGYGTSHGVLGNGASGNGVAGISTSGNGVRGMSTSGTGVSGTSSGTGTSGVGVWGTSSGNGGDCCGVLGQAANGIGVRGGTQDGFAAVAGQSTGKGLAGYFAGNVQVTASGSSKGNLTVAGDATVSGDLTITGNIASVNTITVQGDVVLQAPGSDCAEQFDVCDANAPEPGTVMVIDDEGKLRESSSVYDKRAAGVVSGAGEYRPAILLDGRRSSEGRASVALVGKVYCKVDADPAPIAVGDLLTTSARPGFGMKATDPGQAFGAVIGKALKPLRSGQGLIPILVALQ
jgi:hypothetical protein